MSVIGQVAARALDLAFPAACAGCGREGEPICAACAPALDVRLDLPAGEPIGLPAELPDGAPPGRVVRAVQRRSSATRSTSSSTAASGGWPCPLGAAIARRWARAGRRRRPPRAGAGPPRPGGAAWLRPGGPAGPGGRRAASGCPCVAALERRHGDDRPVPARSAGPRGQRRRRVPRSVGPRAAAIRGSLGRPRRRRHDHRRHALRPARRRSSRAGALAVSAVTVARER